MRHHQVSLAQQHPEETALTVACQKAVQGSPYETTASTAKHSLCTHSLYSTGATRSNVTEGADVWLAIMKLNRASRA